jgi:Kdo2-lipid IVA lauroyltransferase/acyltransferase
LHPESINSRFIPTRCPLPMHKTANYLVYFFFRLVVGVISLFPFAWLHSFAGILAFLVRDLIKYRIKTVRSNIKSCPALAKANHADIEHRFYRYLTTHLLEALKGFTAPLSQLESRYKVMNPEILLPHFEQNQSILLIGSHYNNWEWGIQVFNRVFAHRICGIYQRVSNPFIHQYLMKQRSRSGMRLIGYEGAVQTISSLNETSAVMILADQSPSNMEKAVWADFLGRPTPFVHGLEAMGKRTGFPMYYYDVMQTKPGWYEVLIQPLSLDPVNEQPDAITLRYAACWKKQYLKILPGGCGHTSDGSG